MPRNRSSSLPPTIAASAAHFQDRLHDGSVIKGPRAISRSFSAGSDASTPQLNCVESNAELGPIHKRSVSNPMSAVRVSTNPPVGEDTSQDGDTSLSDESSVEDGFDTTRMKDAMRRYHALKELLATEYSYLQDLRFLVTVYLRNLPTLVVRTLSSTSTFASFTTGPSSSWMHSPTSHLSSITGQYIEPQNASAPPSSRFLFTDHEVDLLKRNGEEILEFHERFVKELVMVLGPLGFSNESWGLRESHVVERLQLADVDEAIKIVATKFSTEASRFNIYQTFCAGHPEAMDVLRRALRHFPVELDIFEHQSSFTVAEMLETKVKPVNHGTSSSTQKPPRIVHDTDSISLLVDPIMPSALEDRKRTLSLTSLDDRKVSKLTALKLRASMTAMTAISIASSNEDATARSSNDETSDLQPSATASSGGTNVSGPTKVKERDKTSFSPRKLAMADYMIKPVQRICKYPLLLDQLRPSKVLRDVSRKGTNMGIGVDVVESAAQAMRRVATSVDVARERQSIATQSSLIFSRICLGLQVQGMLSSGSFGYPYSPHSGSPPHLSTSSSRGSTYTQTQNASQIRMLTPAFLSSLGPCLLSGSLDVIHYSHNVNAWLTGTIKGKVKMKAKYLGAFLYDGGYLVFVKVGKGKRYEPRHWFALDGWDVVSVDDEEAMLPHSFRLSKAGQHFELAASCVREKGVWLASIAEAIKHAPAWIGEPMPSFISDGSRFVESTTPSASASDDGHSEPVELVEERLNASSGDVGGLPTICSIPDVCGTHGSALETESRSTRTEPFFASLREHVHGKSGRKKRLSTMSGSGSKCHPQPPQLDEDASSRRSSSSTSVMSIFSPIHMTALDREKERDREKAETVLITRSSATARQAIDFGLQDVVSALCASARAEAAWKEKVDVGSAVWGSTWGKTNSSMAMGSMSRGMAILSKHESVRLPRKRTSVMIETLSRSVAPSASTNGTSRRTNVKKMTLTSFSFNEYDKSTTSLPDEPTSITTFDSPSPHSLSSQAVMENLSATPMSATFTSVPADNLTQTKPSRSFVQNVKDLFHFRHVSTPPVSVIVSHPTQNSLQAVDVLQQENRIATTASHVPNGLLKRFTKDSGRAHGDGTLKGDELDFVTIASIHRADGDVAKEKFSIAVPLVATPVRVI